MNHAPRAPDGPKDYIIDVPVRPGVKVEHRAGVVQDLRDTRPHDHPQVDPLRPRLRGGEVHPTSEISFKMIMRDGARENWGISMLETQIRVTKLTLNLLLTKI